MRIFLRRVARVLECHVEKALKSLKVLLPIDLLNTRVRQLPAVRAEVVSEVDAATSNRNSPSPWSKAAFARMTHADSALRESMRLNGFVARGIRSNLATISRAYMEEADQTSTALR